MGPRVSWRLQAYTGDPSTCGLPSGPGFPLSRWTCPHNGLLISYFQAENDDN